VRILGVSAYYHDSAAALVVDGRIEYAAQEERFTRRKHDAAFPREAIRNCLETTGVRPGQIDLVAFYAKPFLTFERLLETYLAFAPRGFASFRQALPLWLKEKLFQKALLVRELGALLGPSDWQNRLIFSEHHLSHAASAFFPSPFERAAVLTVDGVGEWATTSLALGNGKKLEVVREIHFPHSPDSTRPSPATPASGQFRRIQGHGVAPTARASTLAIKNTPSTSGAAFRLNLDTSLCTGLTMTSERFDALFGGPPRKAEARLTQRDLDLAASIQAITEEVVLKLGRSIAKDTGEKHLCLAGGVALNCVANGKLARSQCFERIWVQPAAGDAGGAVGAALVAAHMAQGQERPMGAPDGMRGAYLGPSYAQADIERRLNAAGAAFDCVDDETLIERCAAALAGGKALGWHQGRMEFGPRALGGRSILGDPRSPGMQKLLNPGEVPGILPPVRPIGAARGRRGMVRAGRGQSVHVTGGGRAGPPSDRRHGRAGSAVRDRQAERAALLDPCRHARGRLGAHPDRAPRDQPALPRAHQPVQGAHRLSGRRQHQLQRAR
jgi:carbamoyltransferase